ncbi:MAG: NAD(P)-dependent oxidoreductase [Pseudomonadota bacterium]
MKKSKIVLTGAAGRLGSHLREPIAALAHEFVSSDIMDGVGNTYSNERYHKADITSLDAMLDLLEGCDTVVHFGAIGDERDFDTLLGPNFIGAYNVWEAAHRQGVRRVVYASSIHAVGMYPKTEAIGVDVPHRPDTFYGLAKCFAEDLGRMYWEKRGLESVCMRICSCAQVTNARALGTWLSYDDLIQLVVRSIDTPVVEFTVVYGISNNDRAPLDNTGAKHLGYRPQDNAEQFAADILGQAPQADPQDLAQSRIGGPFAATPLGSSGLATMKIVDDTKRT